MMMNKEEIIELLKKMEIEIKADGLIPTIEEVLERLGESDA